MTTPAGRSRPQRPLHAPTVKAEVKRKRTIRIGRDTALLSFAIGGGAYEIVLGGGRPSVLAFLGGVFMSPLVLRIDESRRNGGDQ